MKKTLLESAKAVSASEIARAAIESHANMLGAIRTECHGASVALEDSGMMICVQCKHPISFDGTQAVMVDGLWISRTDIASLGDGDAHEAVRKMRRRWADED